MSFPRQNLVTADYPSGNQSLDPARSLGNAYPIISNRVVAGGDSRMGNAGPSFTSTQYNTFKYGQLTTINELLGGRLNIVANLAASGTTIKDVLDYQVPQLSAYNARYFFLQTGFNSWNNGVTYQTAVLQYTKIVEAVASLGMVLVAFTDIPGNIVLAQQIIAQQLFNSWLRNLPLIYDNVIVIDAYSAAVGSVADGTSGKMLTTLSADGAHLNTTGSYAVAREAFAVLDPIIPKVQMFSRTTGNWAQMHPNPCMEGNNASGSGRWTASTGVTGNGPNDGIALCGGSGTAVTSMVQRSASTLAQAAGQANRTGQLLNIAFTSTAANDTCTFQPVQQFINPDFVPWQASIQRYIGQRVKPTIPNGYHYAVTAGNGTAAGVTEPNWPTAFGATVVDGGLTLMAVQPIDIGTSVYGVAEVYMGSLVGSVGCYLNISFYDGAFSQISSITGSFFDAVTGGPPSYAPTFAVIQTPVYKIPAGTVHISSNFVIKGAASSSATVQLGNFELRSANF